MSNELYFLPPIIDAFQQPNQKEALSQAFQQITEKRDKEEYQVGYAQFEVLMNQAESFSIEAAMAGMDQEFDVASDTVSRLILLCDDQPIGSFNVEQPSSTTSFEHIQPGLYQLRTKTGWVIWEERLSEDDLLWSRAFPSKPLLLAADTDESQQSVSKTFLLLDNTVEINIYPGPEFGSLIIQCNPKGMGK